MTDPVKQLQENMDKPPRSLQGLKYADPDNGEIKPVPNKDLWVLADRLRNEIPDYDEVHQVAPNKLIYIQSGELVVIVTALGLAHYGVEPPVFQIDKYFLNIDPYRDIT